MCRHVVRALLSTLRLLASWSACPLGQTNGQYRYFAALVCGARVRLSPAPLSSLPLEVVSIGISTDARICSDSDTEPRAVFLCLAPGLHTLPFRTAPRPAASTLSHSLSHSHDYAGRTASHEHCCPSYIFTYYIPHSIALRPDPRHSLISCFSPAAVHARLVLQLIPAG